MSQNASSVVPNAPSVVPAVSSVPSSVSLPSVTLQSLPLSQPPSGVAPTISQSELNLPDPLANLPTESKPSAEITPSESMDLKNILDSFEPPKEEEKKEVKEEQKEEERKEDEINKPSGPAIEDKPVLPKEENQPVGEPEPSKTEPQSTVEPPPKTE